MKHIVRSFGQLACVMWMISGITPAACAAVSEIGVVMNVEGSLSAKGTDGALRPLASKGKVLAGDTLFTGKDSYARIKFSDGGQISLRPTTQFRIDSYHYDEQQPGKDAAGFNLLKGSLRAISGLVGKRGDPDSYSVKTREATAGIRGTKFGVRLCQGDCGDVPPPPDGSLIADGTHFDVLEGTIIVRNSAGSQLLNAGQFGYVSTASTPPIEIPPEHAVRVEIPPKISLDNIRGPQTPAAGDLPGINVPANENKPANSPPPEEPTSSGTGDAATPNTCPK
jgi:hypothetical protein